MTEDLQQAPSQQATIGEGRKRALCKKMAGGALWALQAASSVLNILKFCMAEGLCMQ